MFWQGIQLKKSKKENSLTNLATEEYLKHKKKNIIHIILQQMDRTKDNFAVLILIYL